MAMWNPWRGCKKCSEGCLHCYIHKGDKKRNINTNDIVKTKDFYKPIERLKNGNYKMKAGLVYLCFSTDFFIEEADEWRKECWRDKIVRFCSLQKESIALKNAFLMIGKMDMRM